jgi:molecular chaperone DnaK
MSKILGIDLGTTFSAMAVIEAGEPKIIENKEGARTTPSIIAVNKKGERLVGVLAQRQTITNPENTVFGTKRLIGRKFSDPIVQEDARKSSFKIKGESDDHIEVKMGDQWYRPVQISAMILSKLKKDAEEKLGTKIEEAVITCPAYFNDDQRQETKAAGEIAGLKVRRIINEPTAAALAYGLSKRKDEQILVYDFGGGTFDVSILDIGDDTIEVKATGGDTHLGGNDFDQKISDWIIGRFKQEEGIDLSQDPLALQRIKDAAEKAKIELSTTMETEVNLPFITSTQDGPRHLLYSLSRAKLEEMVSEYVIRSLDLTNSVLKDADLKPEEIEEVILVGGQTRMPKIQEEIKKLFNREPNRSINPDEVVAIGAAVQGGILQGEMKDVLLLDVVPLSLGLETMGGIMTRLIDKNTTIPARKSQIFSTAADNQPSVEINILQGERTMALDNRSLGKFILDGIPSAPRGIPQIEVSFDIDANGILNVSAKDKGTNKEQSVRIEGSASVSKEEIEKMKDEAQKHSEQDEQKRQLIELRNQADALIYSGRKTIQEMREKISEEDVQKAETELSELEKVKEEEDVSKIKEKVESLQQLLQKIGTDIYQKEKESGQNNESGEEKDTSPEEEKNS